MRPRVNSDSPLVLPRYSGQLSGFGIITVAGYEVAKDFLTFTAHNKIY